MEFVPVIRKGERGPRVKDAQYTLTVNRFRHNFHPGPLDGVWGGQAGRATDEARFELGYPFAECVAGTFGQKLYDFLRTDGKHQRLPASYLVRRVRRRGKTLDFRPLEHDARECAQQLLRYQAQGRYHADNPGDLADVQRTAAGKAVWSQGGYWVHIDAKVMQMLCYLIGHGFAIGTYAICSDHHNDGPHGHAGGHAVDISSIDGVSVAGDSVRARVKTLAIDSFLQAAGPLRPRQLISGGFGNHRDAAISRLSIPAADSYYGSRTMAEHCNHVHAGF